MLEFGLRNLKEGYIIETKIVFILCEIRKHTNLKLLWDYFKVTSMYVDI